MKVVPCCAVEALLNNTNETISEEELVSCGCPDILVETRDPYRPPGSRALNSFTFELPDCDCILIDAGYAMLVKDRIIGRRVLVLGTHNVDPARVYRRARLLLDSLSQGEELYVDYITKHAVRKTASVWVEEKELKDWLEEPEA